MTPSEAHGTPPDKHGEKIQQENLWRQMGNRLYQRWRCLQERVGMGLFGISGAITVGTIQHVIQACQSGNCLSCGRCAVALTAASVSASAGIATRVSGRRRWLLIAVTVLVGLMIYGVLEMLKSYLWGFRP